MKNNNIWRNTYYYIIVLGFHGSKYMFDNISLGCIGIISYLSGSIKCTSPTLLITRIIACILINTVITCRDWVKSATFTNCSWLIAAEVLTLTLYYWAIIIETRDNKAASAHPSNSSLLTVFRYMGKWDANGPYRRTLYTAKCAGRWANNKIRSKILESVGHCQRQRIFLRNAAESHIGCLCRT